MSFSRFRKPSNTSKAHDSRRNDISISSPTDTLYRTHYTPSPRTTTDNDTFRITATPGTSGSGSASLPNSLTMKTLNPRRLSLRRKIHPTTNNNNAAASPSPSPPFEHKHIPEVATGGGRPEFTYKPLRRTDYPTVVAETVVTQSSSRPSPSSRYQYFRIPTATATGGRGQYMEEFTMVKPWSRSRAHAHYALNSHGHGEDYDRYGYDGARELYNDLDQNLGSSSRREHTYTKNSYSYTPAVEKRRSRSSRQLTTVMVPDPEEIYG